MTLEASPSDPRRRPAPLATDELIDDTIRVLEPRYGRPLSREEAREILFNTFALFQALAEWDRELSGGRQLDKRDNSREDDAA